MKGVLSDSSFNHPLSSRYEEMDSIVVFDHVLVPWNRVFFYDNAEAAKDFMTKSSFHATSPHHSVSMSSPMFNHVPSFF